LLQEGGEDIAVTPERTDLSGFISRDSSGDTSYWSRPALPGHRDLLKHSPISWKERKTEGSCGKPSVLKLHWPQDERRGKTPPFHRLDGVFVRVTVAILELHDDRHTENSAGSGIVNRMLWRMFTKSAPSRTPDGIRFRPVAATWIPPVTATSGSRFLPKGLQGGKSLTMSRIGIIAGDPRDVPPKLFRQNPWIWAQFVVHDGHGPEPPASSAPQSTEASEGLQGGSSLGPHGLIRLVDVRPRISDTCSVSDWSHSQGDGEVPLPPGECSRLSYPCTFRRLQRKGPVGERCAASKRPSWVVYLVDTNRLSFQTRGVHGD